MRLTKSPKNRQSYQKSMLSERKQVAMWIGRRILQKIILFTRRSRSAKRLQE